MYLCIYVSMYLCIYVSMYLCIYVSMYLCIYGAVRRGTDVAPSRKSKIPRPLVTPASCCPRYSCLSSPSSLNDTWYTYTGVTMLVYMVITNVRIPDN
ncbi:hypothetical protein T484DRAFT_1649923 [Baffinella frigidus]|nr:hypothetical protein T484DRAFT_1649923 [Cryptophyta sp. CCMP2293]